MVMEMVDPLHDPVLRGPGERDVVPGLEVRNHVAQTHASSVRTHGDALTPQLIYVTRYWTTGPLTCFAAIKYTANTSFTPLIRAESI